MTTTPPQKKVVVIGAGFAGFTLAGLLDGKCDLTVLTMREDFSLIKYGGLRAAVAGNAWIDRAMPTTKNLLKKGKVVVCKVVSVDEIKKVVVTESGAEFPYDVLVVASGSRNLSPGEPPVSIAGKDATKTYYNEQKAKLATAKSIVIVGAGAVGLELAGELREFGAPNCNITIVTKAASILSNTSTPLKANQVADLARLVTSMKIDIIYNEEVTSVAFPVDMALADAVVPTPKGVDLKSGKHVDCDILVWAVGNAINTSYLPEAWLDAQTREVKIDKTFKLTSKDDVFSLGDAAQTDTTKLGYLATEHAKVVAVNVLQVLAGKKAIKEIQPAPSLMLVPMGTSKGRMMTPMFSMGNYVTGLVKGRGLFEGMVWGAYKAGTPPKA